MKKIALGVCVCIIVLGFVVSVEARTNEHDRNKHDRYNNDRQHHDRYNNDRYKNNDYRYNGNYGYRDNNYRDNYRDYRYNERYERAIKKEIRNNDRRIEKLTEKIYKIERHMHSGSYNHHSRYWEAQRTIRELEREIERLRLRNHYLWRQISHRR